MKPVRFHPQARAEMREAAAYYETQQEDLGKRFLLSVRETVSRIQLNPRIYPVVQLDVRRALTRTFPFGILFRTLPDRIIIMAVMHLRREPDYWKRRGHQE